MREAGVRPWKMRAAASCVFILLQLCSGADITCSVTRSPDQTTYSINDVDHILDPSATKCEYMWINGMGVSIANPLGKIAPVTTHSIDRLVISGCLENITFKRNCVSERVEHTANCSTGCRESASFQGDKETVSWIPPVIVPLAVAVAVAVGVGVSAVLCWKFRDKPRSPRCQCGGFCAIGKSSEVV